MDMLIVAHALSLRLTLVTNNSHAFTRVQGLSVENGTT
jgi:predicted nucleic acid-binding protein